MQVLIKQLTIALSLLIASQGNAFAAQTGWMSGYKAYKTYLSMERQGFMPASIECRDSNRAGLDVGETEYNINFVKNSQNVEYLWAVGSEYGRQKIKAQREGFKQISFDKYTRKISRLIVRCAIWQKK